MPVCDIAFVFSKPADLFASLSKILLSVMTRAAPQSCRASTPNMISDDIRQHFKTDIWSQRGFKDDSNFSWGRSWDILSQLRRPVSIGLQRSWDIWFKRGFKDNSSCLRQQCWDIWSQRGFKDDGNFSWWRSLGLGYLLSAPPPSKYSAAAELGHLV